MARKKLTDDQKLERKRLQRKLSMRRAREKLKDNPEKLEERRLKDRQRYERKKQQGKVKTISQMSPREQRQIRKGWKQRAKKYRGKKKDEEKLNELLEGISPPPTPDNSPRFSAEQNVPMTSRLSVSRKEVGRKLARKNRHLKNQKIKELQEKLQKATKKANKYKQRLFRMKYKCSESPNTKVKKLLIGKNLNKETRRKLLFGEVISKQLNENFKTKDKYKKKHIKDALTGKWIEKYKFMNYIRSLTSRSLFKSKSRGFLEQKKIKHYVLRAKADVRSFLERDECSRLTPGKKDTITRKKVKKQKRLLNNTLKNLHKTFTAAYPVYEKMSYSTFCKLRPFWVVFPKVTSRDTCLCRKHANINFIIAKLGRLNILSSTDPDTIVNELCCKGDKLKQSCLERTCINCKEKQVNIINEFDGFENINYFQWINRKTPVIIKGKEKLTVKTSKEEIYCTKYELVQVFLDNIYPYMEHLSNIMHQYKIISEIKKGLSEEDVLLHCDFSENYNCKYSEEVQSMHFGGSRAQVTLHTSVLYYKTVGDEEIKHKNFCSLSECSRHDPAAICAHLSVLIEDICNAVPKMKRIHFLTDGPTNQYRNKSMFYLMAAYLPKIFNVNGINWHFSEAGHGKGAPDGIGGCLKRTADRIVSQGTDIEDFGKLICALKTSGINIRIFEVKEETIYEIDQMLLQVLLKCFKGTFNVHELAWSSLNETNISARRLSCILCKNEELCIHYGMGFIPVPCTNTSQTSIQKSPRPTSSKFAIAADSADQLASIEKVRYSDIYSDSENDDSTTYNAFEKIIFKPYNYILVKFIGKKTVVHYIGLIINADPNRDELNVKFLRKSCKDLFVFPHKDDISQIEKCDVVGVMEQPVLNNRGQYKFCLNKFSNLTIN